MSYYKEGESFEENRAAVLAAFKKINVYTLVNLTKEFKNLGVELINEHAITLFNKSTFINGYSNHINICYDTIGYGSGFEIQVCRGIYVKLLKQTNSFAPAALATFVAYVKSKEFKEEIIDFLKLK